ncbi:hypothetical protein ABES02_24345 [Neobacillus pocheonensis]|uniref:hypothetical protein n=1 Tax=Neobacillus pocheonensis TaxID=363869 RepID=UPI003D2A6365
MKFRFTFITVFSLISMILFGAVALAATDFTQFGFPKVVAEKEIDAGNAAKISHSGIKIDIPEGAFTTDVKFQLLEGDNSHFQVNAPAGETVIMNFAFRVVDSKTNEIIAKFNRPVMFSFKDKDVNQWSIYNNVTTDGIIAPNQLPAVIDGRTLTHPIAGAPVGWVITSPTHSVKK